MRTSPAYVPNFDRQLHSSQKASSPMANTGLSAHSTNLHFSGDDPLELTRVNSSDSIQPPEIKEKLEEVFGKSKQATVHYVPVQVNFALIKELALDQKRQEKFLDAFSPRHRKVENAKGQFVSKRVLVYFTDLATKDDCLSYIPGGQASSSWKLSDTMKNGLIKIIQGISSVKGYKIKNNLNTDGTVVISRTAKLHAKHQATLQDQSRCMEQKKYIIHTKNSALASNEIGVEVQIALKTQAEIDAEQGTTFSKEAPKKWATWPL